MNLYKLGCLYTERNALSVFIELRPCGFSIASDQDRGYSSAAVYSSVYTYASTLAFGHIEPQKACIEQLLEQ